MAKTQHCIPHFLLDKYYPNYSEIVSVQKLLAFELKILAHEVVHSVKPHVRKHIVVDAPVHKAGAKHK